MAQIVADLDFHKSFGYWWERTKWTGILKIKWIYVKDIEYTNFEKITFQDKSVTQHRDGTRLDFEAGMKMLKVYEQFEAKASIFEDFTYMDDREEKLRIEREVENIAMENLKPTTSGGYQGHHHRDGYRGHRGGDRDRDLDRDRDYNRGDHRGGYRKYNNHRYSNNSEYHPKKEGTQRRERQDEYEEKYEDQAGGIFIQKKQPKQKKLKGKTGRKDDESNANDSPNEQGNAVGEELDTKVVETSNVKA